MRKCYLCDEPLENEYQVKIIDIKGEMQFVKCCSLECAEKLKEENASIHESRYEDVIRQCIQKLK